MKIIKINIPFFLIPSLGLLLVFLSSCEDLVVDLENEQYYAVFDKNGYYGFIDEEGE